jgi:hypothetical protein
MSAATALDQAPVEVACDESGFTGGNLTIQDTVFVHASIRIASSVARVEMDRLGRQTVSHGELKAAWLLRRGDRADLRRLLDPAGPLVGPARVHLIDTRLFLLARLADVLLGSSVVSGLDLPGAAHRQRALALVLRRHGEQVYGTRQWREFLVSAGNALRRTSRWVPVSAAEDFVATARRLMALPAPAAVRDAMHQLGSDGARLHAIRRTFLEEPRRPPLLEPLLPALTRAVLRWGAEHPALVVVHDEQSALTRWRITDIAEVLSRRHPGHTLDLVRVDSRVDPRVQVADLVAGVARRAAAGLLAGRPDPELVDIVRPLVDPRSVWPDDSWSAEGVWVGQVCSG